VQETQPGRLFNLTVNFPAGFQIKADQKLEVTLKSNHPKFPLIKVPVFVPQTREPAPARGVAPVNEIRPAKTSSRSGAKK